MSKIKARMVNDGHLGGYIAGGDPATWCPHLWNWTMDELGVSSVLDVGCGEAHSTRFFLDNGCDTLGLEGSRLAIEASAAPGKVRQHDFCQGPYVAGRPFDMVWSCEFLEHVDAEYVPNILGTFAQARRAILVTHAFPGQDDGYHHVNCQPSSYWIRHIEQLGFRCDVRRSLEARRLTLQDYPGINHFARSGLLFVRVGTALDGAAGSLPGRIMPPSSALGAWWSATRINYGFRLSGMYRRRRRQRRAVKRLERQATLRKAA